MDRLEKAIIGLENYPKKFRQYEKEVWHGRGLRVMPVDNYLVFYISADEAATVTIVRVTIADGLGVTLPQLFSTMEKEKRSHDQYIR